MMGDSGTILPDGLTRPDHWPEFTLLRHENSEGGPSEEDSRVPVEKDFVPPAAIATTLQKPPVSVINVRIQTAPHAVFLGALSLSDQITAEIRRLTEKNWPDDLAKEEAYAQIALLETIKGTLNAITTPISQDETPKQTKNRWLKLLGDYSDEVYTILDTKKRSILSLGVIAGIAGYSGTIGYVLPASILMQIGGPKLVGLWKEAKGLTAPDEGGRESDNA
jgi:hypothetical protein